MDFVCSCCGASSQLAASIEVTTGHHRHTHLLCVWCWSTIEQQLRCADIDDITAPLEVAA